MLSVLLAVLAAVANALSSVLQRKAAREAPREDGVSPRLVWRLLHRPVWLCGVLAIIAGFLLQATALSFGRISVVQPVLVMELPATLLLSSLVFKSRLGAREWGASAAMAAGLAGLLFSLSPSGVPAPHAGNPEWAVASGLNIALIAALVAWARLAGPGARRTALLGVATGCTFGFTAALIKGVTEAYAHGFATLFTSWQLYAMIVAGAGAMVLLQAALQAGRLLVSQPGMTMSDPVVAIMWGIFVFGEVVRGGFYILMSVVAAAVVATGVILLARSPLLAGTSGRDEREGSGGARAEAAS
ncbi:DMT family transporter [Streptomyces sp. NTH33]|uniref:DMT family transporter n=1 Tax=Streptomyces sp. NTH33 TaxID=1735453 RepID=UPI0011B9388D|nr:DMT family transporter [Streptomyces sp. NTH33]